MITAPHPTETYLLHLPKTLRLQISVAQFEMLAIANRELSLERNHQGELIVNPPTSWETGERNSKIIQQLANWNDRNRTGKTFDSSTGFTLPNGAIRSPDASWISLQRWSRLTPQQKSTFPQICPDFVVELRSPSDTLSPLQAKMAEYRDNGTRLGWLIDPQNRQVSVYQPETEVMVLDNPNSLSGEAVLLSFVLDLSVVWDVS
ncbi:MAG: Uma2 family endonuclease [Spirulinaceae cyanobacterium]